MTNSLDELKNQHPEWCFQCGALFRDHYEVEHHHDANMCPWRDPNMALVALVQQHEAELAKARGTIAELKEDNHNLRASLRPYPKELDWPESPFFFYDSAGEHDPCYVGMPGNSGGLALNHHAVEGVDIARAKWIVDACNARLPWVIESWRREEADWREQEAALRSDLATAQAELEQARSTIATLRDSLQQQARELEEADEAIIKAADSPDAELVMERIYRTALARHSARAQQENEAKKEVRETDWQPIETAPKDGTVFIAASTLADGASWVFGTASWRNSWPHGFVERGTLATGWTHWMPLPEPPVQVNQPQDAAEAE